MTCDIDHVTSQVAEGQAATDHRLFIRTIIRHSDFVTRVRNPFTSLSLSSLTCNARILCIKLQFTEYLMHRMFTPSLQEAAYDYMVKEGERMFLECLDQLEVARAKLEDVSQTSLTGFPHLPNRFVLLPPGTEDGL